MRKATTTTTTMPNRCKLKTIITHAPCCCTLQLISPRFCDSSHEWAPSPINPTHRSTCCHRKLCQKHLSAVTTPPHELKEHRVSYNVCLFWTEFVFVFCFFFNVYWEMWTCPKLWKKTAPLCSCGLSSVKGKFGYKCKWPEARRDLQSWTNFLFWP